MNIESFYSEFLLSRGICTDSRKAEKGQIFFALKGENFDGNQYASSAIDLGCKLAIIDDPSYCENDKYLVVEDVLVFLQELARYHRQKLNIPIIAITGSNGKTTTKELIYSVLSQKYKTLATQGNLNNHIGVPLTLLKIRNEDMAIIEMGANHPGEIDFLCKIARPGYGIITNIGKAHLEGFGGFEGVKNTKAELYRFLSSQKGTVFINGNNEILRELSEQGEFRKVYYMDGPEVMCDGYVINSLEKLRVAIRFPEKNELHEADLQITGAYNLENILAAACVGSYFDVLPNEVMLGISSYKSSNNRSQFIETEKNKVILDAYNANPTSMSEAIKNFRTIKHHQKILILGDMLEMGEYAQHEHENILHSLDPDEFSGVYLVGNEFYTFKNQFHYHFFTSVEKLIEHFNENPVNNSFILVKGSRGIALEKILIKL